MKCFIQLIRCHPSLQTPHVLRKTQLENIIYSLF